MKNSITSVLKQEAYDKEKQLLIVKFGTIFFTLKVEEIAFIYTENGVAYIINNQGKKYITTFNLNYLEKELTNTFFRANRQFIINVDFIESFSYQNKKVIVKMKVNHQHNIINISPVTAPKFREWIYNI